MCHAVCSCNFRRRCLPSIPSACQNASGNSAAFVSDTTLLPASGAATPTSLGSRSASSMTAVPSATSTKASGAEERIGRTGWWAGIAGVLLMVAVLL